MPGESNKSDALFAMICFRCELATAEPVEDEGGLKLRQSHFTSAWQAANSAS